MNQRELKNLLIEAAQKSCLKGRRDEILTVLVKAVAEDQEFKGFSAGIRKGIESLYNDTLKNRPEKLPALFPAFAVVCGGAEGVFFADVDWSLVF